MNVKNISQFGSRLQSNALGPRPMMAPKPVSPCAQTLCAQVAGAAAVLVEAPQAAPEATAPASQTNTAAGVATGCLLG
jgi:hypothetical protein